MVFDLGSETILESGSSLASRDEATTKIALIGFGEAAEAFLEGWRSEGLPLAITAYDNKTDAGVEEIRTAKWADYRRADVGGMATMGAALGAADIVFSLVTADQALNAARKATAHIEAGAIYFDCNSCAPATKREAAARIERGGGRYVDVAVMAPVRPGLHRTPLLVCGPHADAANETLAGLGMNATAVSDDVGGASSAKMIRSVIMKGLEALVLECLLAGERAGVTDTVLASLDQTYPGFDWQKRSHYMLERMARHGTRRAAELEEVASTLRDLGIVPTMTTAAADWQRRVGGLGHRATEHGADLMSHLAGALGRQPAGAGSRAA